MRFKEFLLLENSGVVVDDEQVKLFDGDIVDLTLTYERTMAYAQAVYLLAVKVSSKERYPDGRLHILYHEPQEELQIEADSNVEVEPKYFWGSLSSVKKAMEAATDAPDVHEAFRKSASELLKKIAGAIQILEMHDDPDTREQLIKRIFKDTK